MLLFEKYNHIIWDWNGTLLDDLSLCIEITNDMLVRRKMDRIDLVKYHSVLDFPIINYYKSIGFNFEEESFKDVAFEFISEYKKRFSECSLQKNVLAILDMIRDAGLSQSVLSASEQTELIKSANYFKIDTYFNKLSGLKHTYATSKVELGLLHIDSLSLNPKRTLLIGDTTHDYDVAKTLGCDCVLVSFGHQSRERLEHCHAPIINSFYDFNSFFIKTTA